MEGAPEAGPRAASHPEISIVLATLNEAENLPQVLDRIRHLALPEWEAIVVDDGSTDGTREYLVRTAQGDPRIRYIFHDGKQTTLRAQCQGIAKSLGSVIVIMDADLQHPPEILPQMIERIRSGSVLVIASRYARGGSPGHREFRRWLYSRGAEWIARVRIPGAWRLSDPVSGYFAFRRSIWIPLNPEFRGYKLLLFVTIMAQHRPVRDVPYRFEPRTVGSSKVESAAFKTVFLKEVRLAREFARERRNRVERSRAEQPL
jgi:dolichol-phosphate mannosyltransferase